MKTNNEQIIKTIQDMGYRVSIYHFRNVFDGNRNRLVRKYIVKGDDNATIRAKGGETHALAIKGEPADPDSENLIGIAHCSEKDGYNRKVGAAIALGRLYKKLLHYNMCPEERALVNAFSKLGKAASESMGDFLNKDLRKQPKKD